MFFKLVKIIKAKKPKAFLLENVKHLKNHDGGSTLSKIMDILQKELKYKVFPMVLNSKDYGLPQNRQRIYIVGFKKEIDFKFPNSLPNKQVKLRDILEKGLIDESYFLSQKYYEGLVKHKERHAIKGNGFGFEVLNLDDVSHALVVGSMGRERNLVKDNPRKGFYKEGMDKAKAKNSLGIRTLTIREYARLQGFPDDFVFPVPKTQAYKQIGNSVSIPVVRLIASNILKLLSN
jgi:DNA (cytosine-5)-methyltransferase 1